MVQIVVLTLAALVTAWLSAVAGLGGGTILIAVMFAFGLHPAVAIPLHAAVQLVSNGTRVIAYLRHVHWPAMTWFLLGAVPSPFVMAPVVAQANPDILRLVMVGFILLALKPGILQRIRLHGRAGMLLAGLIAGGIGSIVGASGLLIGPLFLREGWAKETVIATLAAAQAAAHFMKIVAFASFGFGVLDEWELLLPMAVAVIAGTFLGRWSSGRVSESGFRILFRVILLLLAAKLAWDGVTGLTGGLYAS